MPNTLEAPVPGGNGEGDNAAPRAELLAYGVDADSALPINGILRAQERRLKERMVWLGALLDSEQD